jgi:hypothetical protein
MSKKTYNPNCFVVLMQAIELCTVLYCESCPFNDSEYFKDCKYKKERAGHERKAD